MSTSELFDRIHFPAEREGTRRNHGLPQLRYLKSIRITLQKGPDGFKANYLPPSMLPLAFLPKYFVQEVMPLAPTSHQPPPPPQCLVRETISRRHRARRDGILKRSIS